MDRKYYDSKSKVMKYLCKTYILNNIDIFNYEANTESNLSSYY